MRKALGYNKRPQRGLRGGVKTQHTIQEVINIETKIDLLTEEWWTVRVGPSPEGDWGRTPRP